MLEAPLANKRVCLPFQQTRHVYAWQNVCKRRQAARLGAASGPDNNSTSPAEVPPTQEAASRQDPAPPTIHDSIQRPLFPVKASRSSSGNNNSALALPPEDVFEVAWAAAAAAGDVPPQISTTARSGSPSSHSAEPPEALARQQHQAHGERQQQQTPSVLLSGEEQLDLLAVARRYSLVSLAMFSLGTVLTVWPAAFVAAALQEVQPSSLEVIFARLMGVALLFRGVLALTLKAASEDGRLYGTTAQRVVLGCILPSISHYLAFKTLVAQWATSWNVTLMLLYPAVLAAEFYTHLLAFQVYNPFFGYKLFWPVAAAIIIQALAPPLPPLSITVPRVLTPVTAGAAVLLSRRSIAFVARAVTHYMRSRLVSKAFSKVFKSAGPALTGTVVGKMDFLLPSTSLAWGYFFMMLSHFAVMFDAYMPDHLFLGQVTPVSHLLKQSWSAGFLAAAFACDALKTAADRQHLALAENRNLNLCLALLESGYAACLAIGLANGSVVLRPYSYLQLTTAVVSAVFCLTVWSFTQRQAADKGFPVAPTVSSIDWQAATEQRADYKKVTAVAVVVLNVITSCI